MIGAWIARMVARLYDPAEEARRAQAEESRIIRDMPRRTADGRDMLKSARNSLPEDEQ